MGKNVGTPPGFSRWYFNFIATPLEHLSVAQKLKYHRLKPGGVPTFFPIFVVVKFKDHRLKPGGVRHDKTDAYRTLSNVNWNVLHVAWTNVFSTRSDQLVVGILLEDVCSPTRDATDCEDRGKEIQWNVHHVVR